MTHAGTANDGAIARAAAAALLSFDDPCALSTSRCTSPLSPLHIPSSPPAATSLRRGPSQLPSTTTDRDEVSLEAAWGLLEAVLRYSKDAGQRCCIAVLDATQQTKAQVGQGLHSVVAMLCIHKKGVV